MVASRGLFGWSESLEGQQTLYGLVPDVNSEVILDLLDGSTLIVPVVENVFIVSLPGVVRSLAFPTARGDRFIRSLA